ncbi:hypothetical protein SDC9_68683 [bioreactor metagenome]|uniref:Fido domain-containing protein n=1 Tax=bioreactor metagenome TaxID=1076179 RepID=A0A644Y136_9ZZZZ
MIYKELLNEATELKAQLDDLRPLSVEAEQRVMQKFRLDWNYNSAHIEGNQLTYGETKALIMFGVTAQAKPLKDHIEMTGHNEAIKYIEEVIKQKRPLSEAFIRELHEIILKESYYVDAITPDGQPTKKKINIGRYKELPNHVKTITGEIFYFASPEETPAEMDALMKWYNKEIKKNAKHPVLLASEFHYRFIRIHPFDDGNGRIARLIMNFILMQFGYPPVIIPVENKEKYFSALHQADAGDLEFFFEFICRQVIHSLNIEIMGALGENIDEYNDLDKKIALLKQKIDSQDEKNEIKKSLTIVSLREIFEEWLKRLLIELANTTAKFNDLYTEPRHSVEMQLEGKTTTNEFTSGTSLGLIQEALYKELEVHNLGKVIFRIKANYGAYKKGGPDTFNCYKSLTIVFDKYFSEIEMDYFDPNQLDTPKFKYPKKLLNYVFSDDEIREICMQWGNGLLQFFEYQFNVLQNRLKQ